MGLEWEVRNGLGEVACVESKTESEPERRMEDKKLEVKVMFGSLLHDALQIGGISRWVASR